MWEGGGKGINLTARHPERGTDITNRMTHAIGVAHRYAHTSITTESVEDAFIHLRTTSGLDIDIDIGQCSAQR